MTHMHDGSGYSSDVSTGSPPSVTLKILDRFSVPALAVSSTGDLVLAANRAAAFALETDRVQLSGVSFSEICPDLPLQDIPVTTEASLDPDGEPDSAPSVCGHWSWRGSRGVDVRMTAYEGEPGNSSHIIVGTVEDPLDKFTDLPRWIALLVESLPAFVSYAPIETPEKYQYVNPTGLKMLGLETVEELRRDGYGQLDNKEVAEQFNDHLIKEVQSGRVWQDVSSIQNVKTGDITTVERQIFPVYNRTENRVIAICVIARDVSIEIGERRISSVLKAVIESVPASVTIFAPDKRCQVIYANQASLEINGVERPEQITQQLRPEGQSGELQQQFVQEVLPRVLNGEKVEYQGITTNLRTMEKVPVQRLVFPVYADAGQSMVAVASISMGIEGLMGSVNRAQNQLAEQGVLMNAVQGMYGDEKRRAEDLEKIHTITSHAMSRFDLNELLTYVVRSMRQSFNYYLVAIYTIDHASGELVLQAIDGAGNGPSDPGQRMRLSETSSVTGWVATSGNELLIEDTGEYSNYMPVPGWPETRSRLVLPITYSRKVLGVIDIHSQVPGGLDDRDQSVTRILSSQLAVSMENIRLFDQVREQTLIEERSRLARDIHDSLVQQLSSIHWQLSALKQKVESTGFAPEDMDTLAAMSTLAQDSLAETRRSVWDLSASDMESNALVRAIQSLAERVGQRNPFKVQFECDDPPGDVNLSGHKSAILRICQEAINNVIAHANASELSIRVKFSDTHVELILLDDGNGFDAETLAEPSRESGYGLVSMEEKARMIGGSLEISSCPGHGTYVSLSVPMAKKKGGQR